MWKVLWKKWTIDKPAILGDWLWEVLVVQLADFLDRLTLRRVIAFIPLVVLILAYHHSIPLPPELLLVGDFLAYIDIFSVVLLLGILSRVTTVLFIIKQVTVRATRLANSLMAATRRMDFRHRRARHRRGRKQPTGRLGDDDGEFAIVF